jgi:hypothetical protein
LFSTFLRLYKKKKTSLVVKLYVVPDQDEVVKFILEGYNPMGVIKE